MDGVELHYRTYRLPPTDYRVLASGIRHPASATALPPLTPAPLPKTSLGRGGEEHVVRVPRAASPLALLASSCPWALIGPSLRD
jgi:hypothetical protein